MADPTLQDIITYGGMAAGAAVAAVLVRLGWTKGPIKDTELAISGQASIIDTSPMRDLVKNVDLLTLQLQKTAIQDERRTQALERLAEVLADYLKAQTERQEKNDLAAMVRDELRREMESRGEEPATQPSHKG
jgi:hypothetical protein